MSMEEGALEMERIADAMVASREAARHLKVAANSFESVTDDEFDVAMHKAEECLNDMRRELTALGVAHGPPEMVSYERSKLGMVQAAHDWRRLDDLMLGRTGQKRTIAPQ